MPAARADSAEHGGGLPTIAGEPLSADAWISLGKLLNQCPGVIGAAIIRQDKLPRALDAVRRVANGFNQQAKVTFFIVAWNDKAEVGLIRFGHAVIESEPVVVSNAVLKLASENQCKVGYPIKLISFLTRACRSVSLGLQQCVRHAGIPSVTKRFQDAGNNVWNAVPRRYYG